MSRNRICILLFVLAFFWSGRCLGQMDDFLQYIAGTDTITLKLAAEPLPRDVAAENVYKVIRKQEHYSITGRHFIPISLFSLKRPATVTYHDQAGRIIYKKQRLSKDQICYRYDSSNRLEAYQLYPSVGGRSISYIRDKHWGYTRFIANYSYARPYPLTDYYFEVHAATAGTADSFRLQLIDSIYVEDNGKDWMEQHGIYGYIRLKHDSGRIYYSYDVENGRMTFNDTINQYTACNEDSSLCFYNCLNYAFYPGDLGFHCQYQSIEQHFSPHHRLRYEIIMKGNDKTPSPVKLKYDSLGRVYRILEYYNDGREIRPSRYREIYYDGSSRLPLAVYEIQAWDVQRTSFQYRRRR